MDDTPKLCPCLFYLPLAYNDGTEVEPEVLQKMFRALDRQFGGYTNCGEIEGSWHGQVEHSHAVKVAVARDDIDQLRQVVKEFGKALGQKAMYFEVGQSSVEIIETEQVTPAKESRAPRKK